MRGGQEIGAEHVERFKAYLDSIDTLPARSGKVHVTAVAEAAGLDRQALYKNQAIRTLLEEAVAEKGLRGIHRGDNQGECQLASHLERTITAQDTRIKSLETKNASLMAENLELRRQLAKLRHVEALMEQGRRVAP